MILFARIQARKPDFHNELLGHNSALGRLLVPKGEITPQEAEFFPPSRWIEATEHLAGPEAQTHPYPPNPSERTQIHGHRHWP